MYILEERLCFVCNRGIIEDDFHFFVCECQAYSALLENLCKSMNFARVLKMRNL